MLVATVAVLFFIAVFYGILSGKTGFDAVILSGGAETVTFLLSISGAVCFFCGIASVAKACGLTEKLSNLVSPLLKKLMPAAFEDAETAENTVLNLVSNFFGLGNAATPFGINAAGRMSKKGIGKSLALFIMLNTSSLQLIPSTVIAVRQSLGAYDASKIILPVFLTQAVSAVFAFLLSRTFFGARK